MAGRFSVVHQTTRADAFYVAGLLRHHPTTTLRAALTLAFPGAGTSAGEGARVVVGSARGESSTLCVSLEWDIPVAPEGRSRFAGELKVAPDGDGARLELAGLAQGTAHLVDEVALDRVLGWLALAADAGTSPSGS